MPDEVVVNQGSNFEELVMIQDGYVNLLLRLDKNDDRSIQEFFILPTFSYFGDYQILLDLKSQITYKAG